MDTHEEFVWTGLRPEQARQVIAAKDKSKRDKRCDLKTAVDTFVHDNSTVAIGGFVDIRQPIATCHEMIRHGFRDLTLCFQSGGMAVDYLGGAMALYPEDFHIKRMELAYWAHESFGLSPIFRYLAENGLFELEDWSNYNMSARFKAGSMGLSFIPCQGPLGSDILNTCRAKVVDCPFTGKPVVLLPACYPDAALLHVQKADKYGNCIINGTKATCAEIAMASSHTIVTCEHIVSHEEMTREPKAIAIPFFAVDAVVQIPYGAYPTSCRRHYHFNREHIASFNALAHKLYKGDETGLRHYYENYILNLEEGADFMDQFPVRKILEEHHTELKNLEERG
ncbi:MAG: CoA transferase [Desulfovermiculus sp.]